MAETLEFRLAKGSKAPYWFAAGIAALTLGIPAFIFAMTLAPQFVRFVVDQEGLEIKGDFYGRRIAWSHLDLKTPTEAQFYPDRSLDPVSRTNGLGLPDYRSGWFRLRDGEKGLLFVTERTKLVHLPTDLGFQLLISPEDREGLIRAIQSKGPTQATFPIALPLKPDPNGWLIYLPIVGVALIGLAIPGMVISVKRATIAVGPETLQIKSRFYGRIIPRSSLHTEAIEVIDEHPSPVFRGLTRTNGIGMPGLLVGWFWKFQGGKFLLFVTDKRHSVLVPTDEGYSLIFSPEDRDGFLQALKQTG